MNQVFTSETISDLHGQIELFMEDQDVYDWSNVTIVTEKVKGDEEDDYWWSATLVPKDTASALKDLLCDEHEIIRHFWCKDDIRGLETGGREFTEEEVELIAKKVEAQADCEYGINWQYIDDIAQDIAPDAYVETAEWDDDSDPEEACERDRAVIPYTEEEERLSDLINERGKALNRGGEDLHWCMVELMENVAERMEEGEEELEAVDNAILMMVVDPDEPNEEDESEELREKLQDWTDVEMIGV